MKYLSVSQQWVLFAIAFLLLGSLTFRFYYQPYSTPSEESGKEVVVEFLGEVRQPGIYLFQNPPNLREAIERAGGLKDTAQLSPTFSSTILETGTLLTITRKSSQTPPLPPLSKGDQRVMKQDEIKIKIGRMAAHELLALSIPLDLNQVSIDDLCLIPGIGESLAKEIVVYRESRKGFRSADELKNVRGIGGKNYQNLKGFFTAK
jgi:competence protein ComEA